MYLVTYSEWSAVRLNICGEIITYCYCMISNDNPITLRAVGTAVRETRLFRFTTLSDIKFRPRNCHRDKIIILTCNIDIMIPTGENWRTRSKPCHISTLPTTNPTWTGLGSNPSLRDERTTTNRMSHEKTYGLRSPRFDIEFLRDFLRSHLILINVLTIKKKRVLKYFQFLSQPHSTHIK